MVKAIFQITTLWTINLLGKKLLPVFQQQSQGESEAHEMFKAKYSSILYPHEVFYMGIHAFDGMSTACYRNRGAALVSQWVCCVGIPHVMSSTSRTQGHP